MNWRHPDSENRPSSYLFSWLRIICRQLFPGLSDHLTDKHIWWLGVYLKLLSWGCLTSLLCEWTNFPMTGNIIFTYYTMLRDLSAQAGVSNLSPFTIPKPILFSSVARSVMFTKAITEPCEESRPAGLGNRVVAGRPPPPRPPALVFPFLVLWDLLFWQLGPFNSWCAGVVGTGH